MRVLMFGWEFPPYKSGGLGSACEGMVKALAKAGTEVVFVQPQPVSADIKASNSDFSLMGASGTRMPAERGERVWSETSSWWSKNLRICSIDSLLTFPYMPPELYTAQQQEIERTRVSETRTEREKYASEGEDTPIILHGGYGKDLINEVYRYSLAAQIIAQQERFDVIHAHDWMAYPAGILAKQVTGKPLVCHIHATEADRSGEHMNDTVAHIEWEGMMAADRVVAVSHYTKNLIMRVYNIPEEKIEVVHNAVSRNEANGVYHTGSMSGKQVLFMGRVTFQKGPDYFVEAARLVHNVMSDARFVMAGSGDMLRAMVRRVAKYRLGRCFTFTGFLRGEEVDRMYATSDLYVMPSVSEPFGIAPLEAMAYDVPVLMSKQSGVSEVVNNALKVDFWDTREMAAQICAVLAYPALGRMMVGQCREELKRITWDRAAQKLNKVYAALTAKG